MPAKGAARHRAALFFTLAFGIVPAIHAAPYVAPCGNAVIPNNFGQGDPVAPASLNPLLGPAIQNLQGAVLLFRPLVWPGRNATMDPDRSLAAAIHPLDGGTRFRVTLKPWRWSDATPVTADDVVFCWERIKILGPLFAYAGQGGVPDMIQDVRAISPNEVEFRLKQQVNADWFMLNGLSLIYALPRHAWGDIGRDDMWRRQNDPALAHITDGPFRLTEYHDDRYAAYEPNPLYGGHQAQLARLVITFLEGANPLHAVQAGDADIARVPYALVSRLAGVPGFQLSVLPEPYGYFALIANQHAPAVFLKDLPARRALAQAIDQQAIIHAVYRGLGSENHMPAPAEAHAWRSPAAPAMPYNKQAAALALEAAGWHRGADGMRTRNNHRMEFTAISSAEGDSAAEMQVLQIVQRQLAELGVSMHLRRMGMDQYFQVLGGPQTAWDAASVYITLPAVPDGSGYFDTGGGNNFGAYSDPRMDSLIHASITQPGATALFAYQDYAAAQLPWIILPQGKFVVLVANRLHGLAEMANPLGFWSPEYLSADDGACSVRKKAFFLEKKNQETLEN